MTAVDKNDYQTLFERARVILDTQQEVETYQQLADALGVRRNTLIFWIWSLLGDSRALTSPAAVESLSRYVGLPLMAT